MSTLEKIDDAAVQQEILRLQNIVENWARQPNLWGDCTFKSYLDYVDAQPWRNYPVVTVFISDGEFNRVFDGTEYTEYLYEDCTSLLKQNGYWFERDTGQVYILADDPVWNERYKDYFHWQWVCSLVREDFSDLHDELFAYFSNKPDRMHKLPPREFEILIYEALRNQGFEVHLGPRSGDGGVDVRMFQRDPIGDILTAIQIKRYRPDRKIGLQAIQALHGAKTAYSMEESMFVTTSDYLPGAKAFAARENVSMQLRTSSDVIEWCRQASQGIIQNKAQLVSSHHVKKKLQDAVRIPRQHIVCADTGITVTMNSFALVLKDTKHAALLMELPKQVVDDDGYGQRGSEVPVLDQSALNNHTVERVFRAKKRRGKMDVFRVGLVRIHILRGMVCLGASTTATKTYRGHKRSLPPVFDRPIPGTAPSTFGLPLRTRPGRLTGAHPTAIPPNPFSAPPPRTRKRERSWPAAGAPAAERIIRCG